MKILNYLNNKLKNIKWYIVCLSIIISICNITVPYYMIYRKEIIVASQNFNQLLNEFSYNIIAKSGILLIKEEQLKTKDDYSVGFLSSSIKTNNYINFKKYEIDFLIDGKTITLNYKNDYEITLEEVKESINNSTTQMLNVGILSAFLIGGLHLCFLMCAYMMISYFLLQKKIKYKILIKYSSIAVLISSFLVSLLSLIFISNLIVTIISFTSISAILNLFFILPDYISIEAEKYL